MTEPTGSQADTGAAQDAKAPVNQTIVTADPAADPAPQQPPTEPPATPQPQKAPDWPDDWRDKMAGSDEKLRARLERFPSPVDILKAMRALETKQGELKKPLSENPTPEELAAWRKENDIPESPDKYDLTLADGLVIGDDDKPLVGKFLEKMHGANASNPHVKAALAAYYELVEEQQATMAERDKAIRQQTEDALRGEWGNEYRANVNLVSNFLDTAPNGLKERLLGARLADGTPLGNDADSLRWLASMAREANPMAAIMPGGANPDAIQSEMSRLEKMMGDRQSEYWKGPTAEKNQQRYLELIAAQQRIARK